MFSEICLIIGRVADEKKQKKTCRECWEESLMASSSLSQVFLHLSTLEQSILWSKSILNARCRICRRKGDAEAMLLCDYCDRGHHMYCLKPPLKVRFPSCHFVGYLPSLPIFWIVLYSVISLRYFRWVLGADYCDCLKDVIWVLYYYSIKIL